MAGKTIKRSVAMAPDIHELLRQLVARRGREVTEADLIREAIRTFLDEQADVVGSRRHFQHSLQGRLDKLEQSLAFHLNILIFLLTTIVAEDGQALLEDAIVAAKRDGDGLLEQIKAVRELGDDRE